MNLQDAMDKAKSPEMRTLIDLAHERGYMTLDLGLNIYVSPTALKYAIKYLENQKVFIRVKFGEWKLNLENEE